MMSRARLVAITVIALALIGAIAVTLTRHSGGGDSGAAAIVEDTDSGFKGPRPAFKGAVRPLAPPRDFALRDQDGRLVKLVDERGKVVVLTPMYTTCRESCPIVAQQIRDALKDLPGSDRAQVVALAISVDPSNDTSERARNFLLTRRVRGYLDFLLGSRQELAPVWHDYGFSEQTDEREHNSYVVLLDRGGHQRVGFAFDFLTPEGLEHDLKLLLARRN